MYPVYATACQKRECVLIELQLQRAATIMYVLGIELQSSGSAFSISLRPISNPMSSNKFLLKPSEQNVSIVLYSCQ